VKVEESVTTTRFDAIATKIRLIGAIIGVMAHPQNEKIGSFLALLASISALFVVALYVLGRASAEIFYQRFGISVSAAGLSTPDLVGLAAGWSMWILVLSFPAFFWGVLFSLDIDAETEDWIAMTVVVGTFVATFGLPLAAIFFLGDPGRLTDWALPLVSFGIGLTVLMLSLRDVGTPGGEDVRDADIEGGEQETEDPQPGPAHEGVLRPTLLKIENASAFPYVMIIGLLAIVAIVISLVGLRQQADAAYAGRAERDSPWSFAPSVSSVELAGSNEFGLPVGRCLVEIGESDHVWLLWDSSTRTLWRIGTEEHALRSCPAGPDHAPPPIRETPSPTAPETPTPEVPTSETTTSTIPTTNGRG
jgi:hypothetical protein